MEHPMNETIVICIGNDTYMEGLLKFIFVQVNDIC